VYCYNRIYKQFDETTNAILLFLKNNFYNNYSREDVIAKFTELNASDIDKSFDTLLEEGYIRFIDEKYRYDFSLSEKTLDEIKNCTDRIYHVD
jgi:hypothetical protein